MSIARAPLHEACGYRPRRRAGTHPRQRRKLAFAQFRRPSAATAASVSAANAEAEEAMPVPIGKLFVDDTRA